MSDDPSRKAEAIAEPGHRPTCRDSWIVTCPSCGHRGGDATVFEISLADECFCPACGERFELGDPEGDDPEDEG